MPTRHTSNPSAERRCRRVSAFLRLDKLADALRRTFGVRREERLFAAIVGVVLVALHALVVMKYFERFTPMVKYYWPLFIRNFEISGFDPITYSVVSDWTAGYNVYRHPLLAFYMYVPYQLNRLLMQLTGINCAIFIVAAIQLFFGFYAMIYLRRILREVVGLGSRHSSLMAFYCMSFAYVMLSAMVPDHFIISMMLLLLTLHAAGCRLKSGGELGIGHTIALFVLTAGTSLNNGLKTFVAALFVNGRRFFRPKYLIAAVLVPPALLWTCSRLQYDKIVWPRDMARNEARAKLKAKRAATSKTTTAAPAKKKTTKRVKQGKPISNGEFMRWTDITTSRTTAAVENLFGESIQLHTDHLLRDEFRSRPMVVRYSSALNYIVEAIIVLLFVVGIWCGRRSRFLWLVMSFFMLDMALHMGLGFGINEIYIMSAHWIYAIPIATAYILVAARGRLRRVVGVTMALLTCYLMVYNIRLIALYLLA